MKPIIKYRGGKSKEIKYFDSYIPKTFDIYHEPFFGGGSLFFDIEPKRSRLNDINKKLMNFYRSVRNNYPLMRKELDEIQDIYDKNRLNYVKRKLKSPKARVLDENESFYYTLRDMYNGIAPKLYSDASLYYFINKTAYSGMIRYNKKGEFNVPYGRYKNFNTKLLTEEHSNLLNNSELRDGDYIHVFDKMNPKDFMFLDPPYDTVFSDYGNIEFTGDFDETSHRKLASDFKNLSGPALMIIGSTPLIEDLYCNLIKGRYQKTYGVNIRNRFQSKAEHLIITNY